MALDAPILTFVPRPRIGIPLCIDARERWRPGRVYLYADHAYARAIDAAGALPVHLPAQSQPAEIVAEIDGLLLPGGDDFAPEQPYPDDVTFDLAPPSQIEFDQALLRAALARRIPVLGICYGAQLIALHHGSSLHHHIPLDQPDALEHQLPEADGRHSIDLEPGSRLADLLSPDDEGRGQVNSLHHQAIDELGPGLRATAHAPDGLIEGFESIDERFILGVQWHPEKLDDVASGRLFAAFVQACAAVRARN